MFYQESRLIISWLPNINKKTKIADIGCGTLEYRTVKQPYINDIYKYVTSKGSEIMKFDFDKNTDAYYFLDITSNLPETLLSTFDVILATNLLEHVEASKIDQVLINISRMLGASGTLILTVPYNLPLHNRPFDNGLRPTCEELTKLTERWFETVYCTTWTDEHYREPYISNPELTELPRVTGGVFKKK